MALRSSKELKFRFKILYLDKGFASRSIITYLAQQRQPTIIACPIRGKTGGTKALCTGRRSYRTSYIFTDGTQTDLATVATLVPDKSGQRRRKWLAFIVICLDWSSRKIYRRYRRRFGIECSYRLLRCVRAKISSRNPALLLLFAGYCFNYAQCLGFSTLGVCQKTWPWPSSGRSWPF